MIEELTPFILRTAAQAGGPITVGGLMERLRHELSDKTLRRHLADLISAGRLHTETVSEGRTITVTPAPGQLAAEQPATFFGTREPRRTVVPPAPSRLPLQMRTATMSRKLTAAATRDHKRPRPAPRRAAVLALLNEQPMTLGDIVKTLEISHGSANEHLTALRQAGLVLRHATVRSFSGNRTALWVSTQLRPFLPDPPPCPPPLPRRRNRRVPAHETPAGREIDHG